MKTRPEIYKLMSDYDELKDVLESMELEINDTFVEIIKSTLRWVLDEE